MRSLPVSHTFSLFYEQCAVSELATTPQALCREYKTYGIMQYYSSKTVNLHAIERVDTARISDESVKTNQFLGSNMQVADLVSYVLA